MKNRFITPGSSSSPAAAVGARSSFTITADTTTSVSAAALSAPSAASAPDDASSLRDDGQREQKHAAMVQRLALKLAAQARSSAKASAAPAPTLPRIAGFRLGEHEGFGFAGINNVQQSAVNQGFSVEPPDQALCVGNGYVFEGVNDAFAVYSEAGKLLAGPAQANAFMHVPFSLNVSDPKCLYDAATDRWFVTMIEYNGNVTNSNIMIAVSQSGDPTGSFIVYPLNVTKDGSDFFAGDCPCLGDQPLIGLDANGFYVSTNAFGQQSFQGAQIYALSKAALVRGDKQLVGAHFDHLSDFLPDEFSFSVQPAFNPPGAKGEAGTEYFAQSMRANQIENRLAVWALGNTDLLDKDPSLLTLGLAVIPTQSYAQPVPARQKEGPTPLAELAVGINSAQGSANEQNLDANDQRLSQVMFLNGQLWTAVGTSFASPGAPLRDGVAWFVVNVANSSKAGTQASIAAQGYVAGPDTSHLVYPAMAVNASGEASMVFTLTGSQYYPSAASWKFGSSSIHLLEDGEAPQDGFSAYFYNRPRWGDYSAAAVAGDGSIWMATQFVPGGPRRLAANWGTFIGATRHEHDDD